MMTELKFLAVATLVALTACGQPEPQAEGQASGAATAGTADVSTTIYCKASGSADITGAGVAGIRIREDADEVRRRCNVVGDTTLQLEGQPQPAMRIALDGDTILAEVVDDRIWRIRITSPGLTTSDSLHVGTPASRLAAIPGATVSPGEGNYFMLLPDHCGLSFALEGLPVRSQPWTIAELATMPDTAQVGMILVTGSCHENGGTRILWDTAG